MGKGCQHPKGVQIPINVSFGLFVPTIAVILPIHLLCDHRNVFGTGCQNRCNLFRRKSIRLEIKGVLHLL